MAREIELRHFRYLLAVAQEGTVSGAAARLGMTQPALSRAIQYVESAVGTALFERGHHGVTLTPAGQALYADALVVDQAARTAVARASRHDLRETRLRVTARGCEVDVLQHLVSHHNATRGAHVPARGDVVDGGTQLAEVRAGDTDVTIVRQPFDRRGIDTELVRSDRRVALLPSTYPLAARKVIERADLADEVFPVWSDTTDEHAAYWAGADRDAYPWKPGPVVTDAAQYTAHIRLGHAVGFVPEPLLPELTLTGIDVVQVRDLSPSRVELAWSDTATSRHIAYFVQNAAELAAV
ncbi:LysR family transcriptional regulator [Streptomyces sp. NPDC049916]|uniref:LysR family transcriptional regulator n=1 Tax=Streptomyces sp. NPDC049916 TaxID=3155156 RepID=UPI00344A6169